MWNKVSTEISKTFLFRSIKAFLKEKGKINYYSNFIKKGDLCFDIGANIGERTACFLKLGAQVIAIEPQQKCVEALERRFRNNENVNILNIALGDEVREDELLLCRETDQCSTLSKKFVSTYGQLSGLHWDKKEVIQVNTLDNIIKEYGKPKFCKIDVEGYESKVLLGLTTSMTFISFEFNSPLILDTIETLKIIQLLGDYECNFIKYERLTLALRDWIPIHDFIDQLPSIITSDVLTGEIIVKLID